MLIKIVAGTFGHINEKGFVEAIKPGHKKPIDVKEGVAKRLILAKMAVAVEAPKAPATDKAPVAAAANTEQALALPEYSETNTVTQLKEIAADMGIAEDEIKGAKDKAALLELMDSFKAAIEADDDGDDGPAINAEDVL